MFRIAHDRQNVMCVITDNDVISEEVHKERPDLKVWYTRSPMREDAVAIASALREVFNMNDAFAQPNDDGTWSARGR